MFLLKEIELYSGSDDLRQLARLVAGGKLDPPIEVEASWKDIAPIANGLIERKYRGKAVLHLEADLTERLRQLSETTHSEG
ncbi:hypothetical protein [Cohnella nanjingensis]|nr:hypothetical protein [Cohnella nanjingensis]